MIVREGQKISEIDQQKLESFYRKSGKASLTSFSVIAGIFLTIILLSLVLYFWRTRNWPKKTGAVRRQLLVYGGRFPYF